MSVPKSVGETNKLSAGVEPPICVPAILIISVGVDDVLIVPTPTTPIEYPLPPFATVTEPIFPVESLDILNVASEPTPTVVVPATPVYDEFAADTIAVLETLETLNDNV